MLKIFFLLVRFRGEQGKNESLLFRRGKEVSKDPTALIPTPLPPQKLTPLLTPSHFFPNLCFGFFGFTPLLKGVSQTKKIR